MTAYVSKEELGLMLPGTMYHYFTDAPEYVVRRSPERTAPVAGLFERVRLWLTGWMTRQTEIAGIAALSDAQLADVGLTRADTRRVFDPAFAAEYHGRRSFTL